MSVKRQSRPGYTPTGFKIGFGACSHFKKCHMGKSTCHYEEIDPETMNACGSYIRNHKSDSYGASKTTAVRLPIVEKPIEVNKVVEVTKGIEEEQLSLF